LKTVELTLVDFSTDF
jgi:hypothetical protein